MRLLLLNVLLTGVVLIPTQLHAANSFVGVAPGSVNGQTGELPFEPWVKTALVGDFIVVKNPSGTTSRREIKEISDDFVTVEDSDAAHKNTRKYHRAGDPGPAVPGLELNMKKTKTETRKIGSSTAACETWDGETTLRSFSTSSNGLTVEYVKTAKYQKVISADVPFDGVVKISKAQDDGVQLPAIQFGNKKAPPVSKHFENTITALTVISEVIDFGRGKPQK